YCHEDDDRILLVTYNKTLLQYIKHQYARLADEDELSAAQLFSSDAEVDITNIDSLMYKEFMRYQKRLNKKLEIAAPEKMHKLMVLAIHHVKKSNPDVKVLTPKNSKFLLDEVEWLLACAMTDVETYQVADRVGRSSGDGGTPQKLLKNSKLRAAIFDVYLQFVELLEKEGL